METENRINKVLIARQAILDDLKQRFKAGDKTVLPLQPENKHRWILPQDNCFAGQGIIKCPICGDELRYSRAAYNGHVHAACMNKDCVRWME